MELLSPAGDLQKLRYAVHYGADAVYAAGKHFGLRAKTSNLDNNELLTAAKFCHDNNCKIYVAVNIFAHNRDIEILPDYLQFLQEIAVDAFIISDPAVFLLARELAPEIPIHVSTQANVTSWKAAAFWKKQGAKRIILARELTFAEIRQIREKLPDIELEMFVHGAMCMSYSGRCLLSSYLNARSANQGNCTQPCRWEYRLVEETRAGEYFPVEEDERGTYILNSKDLCLIRRLPEISAAGIDSIKIEGRMKSLYYVANSTRVYKEALLLAEQNKPLPSDLTDELNKISHRHYSEAFFDAFDSSQTQYTSTSAYARDYQFVGEIVETEGCSVRLAVRSGFKIGEKLEIIFPDRRYDFQWRIDNISDADGEALECSKPNTIVKIYLPEIIPSGGIIRKKK